MNGKYFDPLDQYFLGRFPVLSIDCVKSIFMTLRHPAGLDEIIENVHGFLYPTVIIFIK